MQYKIILTLFLCCVVWLGVMNEFFRRSSYQRRGCLMWWGSPWESGGWVALGSGSTVTGTGSQRSSRRKTPTSSCWTKTASSRTCKHIWILQVYVLHWLLQRPVTSAVGAELKRQTKNIICCHFQQVFVLNITRGFVLG